MAWRHLLLSRGQLGISYSTLPKFLQQNSQQTSFSTIRNDASPSIFFVPYWSNQTTKPISYEPMYANVINPTAMKPGIVSLRAVFRVAMIAITGQRWGILGKPFIGDFSSRWFTQNPSGLWQPRTIHPARTIAQQQVYIYICIYIYIYIYIWRFP